MASGLLPLFPLELVLFPGAPLPLHIFEPRYRVMIGRAIDEKSEFGVVQAHKNAIEAIGCSALVSRVVKQYDDGRFDILARGVRRFRTVSLDQTEEFLQAEIDFFDDVAEPPLTEPELDGLRAAMLEAGKLAGATDLPALDPEQPQPSFQAAAALPLDLTLKQRLLALQSEKQRAAQLTEYLRSWIDRRREMERARAVATRNGRVRKLEGSAEQ